MKSLILKKEDKYWMVLDSKLTFKPHVGRGEYNYIELWGNMGFITPSAPLALYCVSGLGASG